MGKIALWRTIVAAYAFTFSDLGRFFRISAIWLSVRLLVNAMPLLSLMIGSHSPPKIVGAILGLLAIAGVVVSTAGYIAFPVAWHRAILVGETKGGWATLRFGRREWRFYGNTLLIGLVVSLFSIPLIWAIASGMLPVSMPPVSEGSWPVLPKIDFTPLFPVSLRTTFVAFSITVVAAALICVPRLLLALPAVAIEERGEVLDLAWKRGRRNTLRLLIGWVVCGAPFIVVNLATISGWFTHQVDAISIVLVDELVTVVDYVGIAVGVGFLSYSYRQLSGYSAAAGRIDLAPA